MTAHSTIHELLDRARAGQPRAVARLISRIEQAGSAPAARELAELLAPFSGESAVVGITGPPGAGKSTLTSCLIHTLRAQDRRVGVLAVDPSSPFSGGALLGDRIRMQAHSTDPGVYIRSLASRGHLGGLCAAVPQAIRALSAAGCDVVLLETVGVGQSEVEVAALADTTLVVLAPGLGDGIQAAKAGVLEIADILVVNKADRDGADQTARDLRQAVASGGSPAAGRADVTERPGWRIPVLRTIASAADGITELVTQIDQHQAWLRDSDEGERRGARRAQSEIESIVLETVRGRVNSVWRPDLLLKLCGNVSRGDMNPYDAAEELLQASATGRHAPVAQEPSTS